MTTEDEFKILIEAIKEYETQTRYELMSTLFDYYFTSLKVDMDSIVIEKEEDKDFHYLYSYNYGFNKDMIRYKTYI